MSLVACHRTPTSRTELTHILAAIEQTDPVVQRAVAERVSTLANDSPQLTLADAQYGTAAVLQHWRGHHAWLARVGPLTTWGSAQVVPSGELSIVTSEAVDAHGSTMRADAHLLLDGEIALSGYPIVHAGTPVGGWYTQRRLYKRLVCLTEHALIATVSDGIITSLRATHAQGQPAVTLLHKLFTQHPQYRTIAEIGLGLNDAFAPLPGNHAANEVWGGVHGTIHVGLGLMPFTPYHITFVCPGLTLVGKAHQVLVGPPLDSERPRYGSKAVSMVAVSSPHPYV